MHLPLDLVPDPIAGAAASRNRGARGCTALLTLLAACGTAKPPANGGETPIGGADDGVWESLPIGARVQTGGYLDPAFGDGARVQINPHVCAHLIMTRAEWDRLIQTVRPSRLVTVYGSKTPRPNGGCLIQLERIGLVAR